MCECSFLQQTAGSWSDQENYIRYATCHAHATVRTLKWLQAVREKWYSHYFSVLVWELDSILTCFEAKHWHSNPPPVPQISTFLNSSGHFLSRQTTQTHTREKNITLVCQVISKVEQAAMFIDMILPDSVPTFGSLGFLPPPSVLHSSYVENTWFTRIYFRNVEKLPVLGILDK